MAASILEGFTKGVVKETKKKDSGISMIYYQEIKEADHNRELRDIDAMVEDLATDGLEQNLVVRSLNDNDVYSYELIAGHRRFAAINILVKQGRKEFQYIPCKVIDVDVLDATRRKILNNLHNDPYTPAEMLTCIEELRYVFMEKKKQGMELKGRIRELIAEDIGLKKSQVGNYEKVINNAIPEVRKKVEDGELTISAAAELASLDDEEQLMFVSEHEDVSLKTIKEYREESLRETPKSESLQEPSLREAPKSLQETYEDDSQQEVLDYEDEEITKVEGNEFTENEKAKLQLQMEEVKTTIISMIEVMETTDIDLLQQQNFTGLEHQCRILLDKLDDII